MNDEIDKQIKKIDEGIKSLKSKDIFSTLTYKERLWEVETAVTKYNEGSQQEDAVEHLINLYKQMTSASKDGENSFNSTIWNSIIFVSGKQVTLDKLVGELNGLFIKYSNKISY